MSSVAHSHEGESPFQAHLALGLHAFAQPLAILRAKLYAESIARMSSDELLQLANDSAGHVERLCTLFNYLQEIVLAESAEPSVSMFPANEILKHVAEGLDLWFQDTGVALSLNADTELAVSADKTKLSQAISSLVLIAHGKSKTGETVSVRCASEIDHVAMVIQNSAADAAVLSAEGRLSLALIETILRKQNGSFTYSLQPLELRACVPSAAITT